MFRGFLTNQLTMVADAHPYFGHFKFYISNLERGIYPLWDPQWRNGVPSEFFLRRIGDFNPFFFLIVPLHKSGLIMLVAYLWFMALYYFLGMVGFFLLVLRVVNDRRAAFLGLWLLMFSSLSTMLYFSYIQLLFVPYFWFFYFLLSFCQDFKKHQLLGATFTLMIILTTYIPFYFVTILLTFLVICAIFDFASVRNAVKGIVSFIKGNKGITVLCIILLFLSTVPGYTLFKNSRTGELALPARQQETAGNNLFSVGKSNIAGGDIASQIYFDRLISNLTDIELGVVYVPLFAFLIFFLGLLTKANRKIFILLIWASVIFLIGLTNGAPLHAFLAEHVFYFKMIRQSYFFFWLLVLPVVIVCLSEQLRQLLTLKFISKRERGWGYFYIFIVHFLFTFFLVKLGNNILSNYVTVGLSFIFCFLFLRSHIPQADRGPSSTHLFLLILLFIVVVQPLQVYFYLNQNAMKTTEAHFQESIDLSFKFKTRQYEGFVSPKESVRTRVRDVYYCTQWFYKIFSELNYDVFASYVNNKFIAYDRVKQIDNDDAHLSEIEQALAGNKNAAFISDAALDNDLVFSNNVAAQAQIIVENSNQFKVLEYDVNHILIETNFRQPKFLVYNDSYHSGWQAFLNKVKIPIYRSNIAFKGVYVPAGKNRVLFRFGSVWQPWLGFFYIVLFTATLIFTVYLWGQSKQH